MTTVETNGASSPAPPHSLNRHVYSDEAVFAAEMRKIYSNTWVFLGHEGQIAAPGDYMLTKMGLQDVILTRTADGAVHALYNRCAHRGATVCQEKLGNSRVFRCRYHGWTYRNDGRLMGITFPAGYGSEIDERRAAGLEPVLNVQIYNGLIWGHAGDPAQSLADYLGPARSYIDRFLGSVPGNELAVHWPPYRYTYPGNWKFQLENSVDGYHPLFTHSSFIKVMAERTGDARSPYQNEDSPFRGKALGNGHTVFDLGKARSKSSREQEYGDSYYERARMSPGGAGLVEQLEAEVGADEALRLLEPDTDFNLALYPNVVLIQAQIRVIQPVAADRTDVAVFVTYGKNAPESLTKLRLREIETFFSPAGFGTPDDIEMFDRAQRGLHNGEREYLTFSRGLEREEVDGNWRIGRASDEVANREQIRMYDSLMKESE